MSFNSLVLRAIKKLSDFQHAHIYTIDNHVKYSTLQCKAMHSQTIRKDIFKLMKALNVQAISDKYLCADNNGKGSLKDLIDGVGISLAKISDNKYVHYVELGPEPIKTCQLIKNLSQTANKTFYTAVDINETSRTTMKKEVMPLLKCPEHFNYIAGDYRNITRNEIDHGQNLTIITMLGFQEGNEHPETIRKLISNMGSRSTYILSEMQLYIPGREDHIFDFYQNQNMIRFSQLVSELQGYQSYKDHVIKIVPVHICNHVLQVAVTLQPIQEYGNNSYLFTNSCIKYTLQQFRSIRVFDQSCHIIDDQISGDGSVVYQLAKYLK